jgi:hypothetical protein
MYTPVEYRRDSLAVPVPKCNKTVTLVGEIGLDGSCIRQMPIILRKTIDEDLLFERIPDENVMIRFQKKDFID